MLRRASRFHIYGNIFIPIGLVLLTLAVLWLLGELPQFEWDEKTLHTVTIAVFFTLMRLSVAYLCALAVSIPLALVASRDALAERIFIPLYDVMQSIPVLAFFPLIVLLFIKTGQLEGAVLTILFLSMVWNIVFTLISGLRAIPRDIRDVGRVFKAPPVTYVCTVLLPAALPSLVVGSLLAWAEGWNTIVVAEVLHTYIPNGSAAQDVLGVGDLLVHSSAAGDTGLFFYALAAIIIMVTVINFVVWQPLLTYAEQFKFDA